MKRLTLETALNLYREEFNSAKEKVSNLDICATAKKHLLNNVWDHFFHVNNIARKTWCQEFISQSVKIN